MQALSALDEQKRSLAERARDANPVAHDAARDEFLERRRKFQLLQQQAQQQQQPQSPTGGNEAE